MPANELWRNGHCFLQGEVWEISSQWYVTAQFSICKDEVWHLQCHMSALFWMYFYDECILFFPWFFFKLAHFNVLSKFLFEKSCCVTSSPISNGMTDRHRPDSWRQMQDRFSTFLCSSDKDRPLTSSCDHKTASGHFNMLHRHGVLLSLSGNPPWELIDRKWLQTSSTEIEEARKRGEKKFLCENKT